MLPVETAFKIYSDLNGKPLDNGYIYFGQANQNPVTSPVTVYWDAAGTQPAVQPLRTLNGYIVRSGNPANVFITGSYSQLVRDKSQRQVYYAPISDEYSVATIISNNFAAPNGAALVGYGTDTVAGALDSLRFADYAALRAYTGSQKNVYISGYLATAAPSGIAGDFTRHDTDITSTDNGGTIIVDALGRRWKRICEAGFANVMWFGAKGNYLGGAIAGQDDTAAFRAAIAWIELNTNSGTYGSYSPAVGPGVLFVPQGSFGLSDDLTVNFKISVKGEGQTEYTYGSRITQTNKDKDIFKIGASAGSTSFSVENMVLRHNTVAGTGNLVNMVRSGGGTVNSQRYVGCTFAQPANLALLLAGDDIVIDNCLFDVSSVSGNCIQLGTAAMVASHVRIDGSDFFNVTNSIIKLVNIDGLAWGASNTVSQPNAATKTLRIFDAITTAPTLATNISITGSVIKGARTLFGGNNVTDLTITGTNVTQGGIGAGEVNHMLVFTGNCSVNICGNFFRGSYDTANFYNDAGAANVFGFMGNNVYANDGGSGDALSCTKFVGNIARSNYVGFTNRQVGEKRATTGAPVNPGNITTLSQFGFNFTVPGATFGDKVEVGTISNAWIAQVGIDVRAFVTAANTARVEYRNVTPGTINVPAHDVWVEVTR